MSRTAVLDQELAPATRRRPGGGGCEERPRTRGQGPRSGAGGGRLALGDVVASAWEGLLAAGSAPCPVCTEPMEWQGRSGRCTGCGAELS